MVFNVADFFAGWVGGVASLLVSHPLDTVKVRQQAYESDAITTIRRTIKYEGYHGFYKGLLFPLLTYGPSNSLFFGVYGNCMRVLEQKETYGHIISPTDTEAMYRVFVSGWIAGFFQTTFYSPVEYVKIILQANTEHKGTWKNGYNAPYKGTYDALKGVYHSDGIRGLYKGYWAMCLRDVPTSGIYVLSYEVLRYSIFENIGSSTLWKDIVAGGIAGLLSIVTVLPMDVVKTSIQTDNPHKPIYNGMIDCYRQLYAKGKLGIFFTGLPIICLRGFPAHAVMFVGYTYTMSFLS